MVLGFVQAQPLFPLEGELASLLAALVWAGSINVYRHYGQKIRPHTLNCFKNIVGVVCLGTSVVLFRPEPPMEPWVWGMLIFSGIIGLAIGDTAFFAALKRLGAQVASAGLCFAPVFAVLLASVVLDEWPTVSETVGISCTVVALAGCIYFGKKGASPMASLTTKAMIVGIVFVLIAAFSQGVGVVTAREALQKTNVLWGTFIRMVPALCFLFVVQGLDHPRAAIRNFRESKGAFPALLIASFFGTFLGVLLLSIGTKYAKAGVVSAITSTFPLWVIPISHVFLKEKTNLQTILCTFLAVGGICYMCLSKLFQQ